MDKRTYCKGIAIISLLLTLWAACSLEGDIEALRQKPVGNPGLSIPSAPSAPVLTTSNGQITVTWTAVQGATAYEVWMGTANNPSTAVKRGSDVSDLFAVITGLTNNTTYYVWIKAKNSAGASGFSPATSGTPSASVAVPQAPAIPTVSIGNGQITVTWAAVSGATSYEVYYSQSATIPAAPLATVTGLNRTITGLTNGTTYYFWVKAVNANGTSTASPMANGKPVANMGAITLVSGNGQLIASWTAVTGADQYEVYRNTSNSIPASPAQTVSTTTVTITGLTNGTTYYVWVKPRNATGTGSASTVVNGKPIANMGAVTLVPGNGQLTASWTAVAGADQYEVYRNTSNSIPASQAQTVNAPATSATISGLTNNTTYYVWVKPKNANGAGSVSAVASGTPAIRAGLYKGSVNDSNKIGDYNLSQSLTYISSYAVSGDHFYIVLGANESVSPASLNYSGKTVGITLQGYGGERTITLASNGSMFTINTGVTLTLDENVTLVGRSTNNASLVSLNSGNLVINAGAKVSGNTLSSNGGGIYVSGGNLTINGGTISGNTAYDGGGICVGSGTVTIHGGTISNNTTYAGGGGIIVNSGGTVTMNGGTISENTANSNNSSGGGGIVVNSGGTVTMNGGTISGNTANNTGRSGGIWVNSGTFIMHSGTISGNTANSGGGIYVYNGTFTINGGTINGNTARGGGVFVGSGTVTMNGGTISGNKSNSQGGGVEVSSGTFTMYGGVISGNTASTYGGGIYVNSSASFKKLPSSGGQNSGIIYGNEETGVDAGGALLKNTAGSNGGHAVWLSSNGRRNTTAGQTDQIDTTTGRGLSANGNAPFVN
jgi:hypothetical protein